MHNGGNVQDLCCASFLIVIFLWKGKEQLQQLAATQIPKCRPHRRIVGPLCTVWCLVLTVFNQWLKNWSEAMVLLLPGCVLLQLAGPSLFLFWILSSTVKMCPWSFSGLGLYVSPCRKDIMIHTLGIPPLPYWQALVASFLLSNLFHDPSDSAFAVLRAT